MRIVLLCETFSRKMGYLQRLLPKYLARLGADVHVIAMDLPPYYQTKDFAQTYGEFSSSNELVPGTVEGHEGYTLHVVGHRRVLGHMRMEGLWEKLRELRPDIVQTMANFGWIPMDAVMTKRFVGFKLFTGNHYHASVFPLAQQPQATLSAARMRCFITRTAPGFLISRGTEKCYAITADCAEVAVRFFGVQKNKIDVCPLGVDTELFRPASTNADFEDRSALRRCFGASDSEILCIYTGRFSDDKNPLLLAKAVTRLASQGLPFRGLFVGNGVQSAAIQAHSGCIVHPFVPVDELASLFRAADIGVWPTQESLSMLDAAACGLPIVVNDTMSALERIQGNGCAYKLNDLADLCRILLRLRNPQLRAEMGRCGAQKMARDFSWESVARRRLKDYQAALEIGPAAAGENNLLSSRN